MLNVSVPELWLTLMYLGGNEHSMTGQPKS